MMERRSFLALIASAPIAALAPWPKFLPTLRLAFHPKAFDCAMAPLDVPFIVHGRGFFRRGTTELFEIVLIPLPRLTATERRFDPARLPQ